VVTEKKRGEEGKKGPGSSKASHFCHREGHWKNDCKHRRERLKKKRQAAEADVVRGVEDTEVLMTSYVENNISQCKGWIFESGSTVYVCFEKELFNSWLQRRKGLSRWWMVRLVRSSALGQSRLQKEMGQCCSGGSPVRP